MRILGLSVLLFLSCSSADVEPGDGLRVLFVGNSLTTTNDLPGVVAAFGAASEVPVAVRSIAYPNVSLEDHWRLGEAQDALASGDWDVVVMQQGPSSLPENQEHLRTWAQRFADEARSHGTEPALYMVWPSEARRSAFPAVVASYTQAAEAAATLLPAGAAWLEAWDVQPNLSLYGPDGFHPGDAGTYLAALVVYGGLTGAPLDGLPARLMLASGTRVEVTSPQARLLQSVAAATLTESMRRPIRSAPPLARRSIPLTTCPLPSCASVR